MAIRRNDRRRLARLAAPLAAARHEAVHRRVELRRSVRFFGYLHSLLRLEGIDPESTCVAIRLREAEAMLAAIPDTAELQRADAEYLAGADTRWIDAEWESGWRHRTAPREEMSFKGELERLMGRYRGDPPEFDHAAKSPFELYAWCLSRHGATVPEATKNIAKAARALLLSADERPDESAPAANENADFSEAAQ